MPSTPPWGDITTEFERSCGHKRWVEREPPNWGMGQSALIYKYQYHIPTSKAVPSPTPSSKWNHGYPPISKSTSFKKYLAAWHCLDLTGFCIPVRKSRAEVVYHCKVQVEHAVTCGNQIFLMAKKEICYTVISLSHTHTHTHTHTHSYSHTHTHTHTHTPLKEMFSPGMLQSGLFYLMSFHYCIRCDPHIWYHNLLPGHDLQKGPGNIDDHQGFFPSFCCSDRKRVGSGRGHHYIFLLGRLSCLELCQHCSRKRFPGDTGHSPCHIELTYCVFSGRWHRGHGNDHHGNDPWFLSIKMG